MTRIGLISDTHSFFDPRFLELFKDVDELWHAGDIGDSKVLDAMLDFKPLRAVFGNIDGSVLRKSLPEKQIFQCENVNVYMVHIGGYPGKYDARIRKEIIKKKPNLFISGHSHILKVMYDKQLELLHLNPGASGLSGFHAVRTALRFVIDGAQIKEMELIELGPKKV